MLPNAFVYTPIEEFSTDDVWVFLLQVKSPWGVDNGRLVGMYKNAQAGECPLVVDTSTPSCGNSRFGCWVCTVVQNDHSMEAMVDNGEEWLLPLLEFRDLLASTQDPAEKLKLREHKRRDGKVWMKRDGTLSPGPYKLSVRVDLLRKLLQTQKQVRAEGPDPQATLISEAELHEIRRIWRSEEGDWEDSVPKIYREITGEDLDWVRDDVTGFTGKDTTILCDVAHRHRVPPRLIAKLVDLARDKQGMARRAGIYEDIDKILGEDWLEEPEAEALQPADERAGMEKA
jgi:DNA sulfur modification protein DndC